MTTSSNEPVSEQVSGSYEFKQPRVETPPTPPPPQDPYAPTAWGQYDEEFRVPSGQKCRVRKLDINDMLTSSFIDELSTLEGVVDKHVRRGQGQPPIADPVKLLQDKRTSRQMAGLVSQVVCLVVTAPKVEMPPESWGDRLEGVVYADTISFQDKIAIFEKAMGEVRSLETFRSQSEQLAERLADEQVDALPTESGS